MRKGRDRNRVRAPRTASRDTRTEYPLPFSSRMWSGGQENTCVGPRQPDTVRPSALDAKGFDGRRACAPRPAARRSRPDSRHQRSPEGRLDHRDHQRTYRARRRVRDHSSPAAAGYARTLPERPGRHHGGGYGRCRTCGRTRRAHTCLQIRPEGGFAQRPQPVIFLLIKNPEQPRDRTPTRRHASRLLHFHVSADSLPPVAPEMPVSTDHSVYPLAAHAGDAAGVRSRPVLGHLKDLHTERRRRGLSYEGQVSVWAGLNRGIL